MPLYSYSLQIEKYQEAILRAIKTHRIIIIKGPTGCGKSTFIPFLLKDETVAIIEPRRIAVISLYNTLSQKIENLGYKMRFSKKCNDSTKMTIFTDGAFLNSVHDLSYDYIIVDEVHERSVRTDMILSVLKSAYRNKLILMSATLNTTKLQEFFKAFVYEIPGESYPVDIKYLDAPTSDYITECYLTIKSIIKNREKTEKKDILVFLPGEEDITDLYTLCKKLPVVVPFKVHSTMTDKDQLRIYETSDLTKVILSTNICETSLTIPNIKYVIDTGLHKNKVFDGLSFLGIQAISRDSAIQRMGRCNRLGPGVCFRLYAPAHQLPPYIPEILRSDLTTAILFIASLKKNIFTFEFIDYPPIRNVHAAIEFLVDKKCLAIMYKGTKFQSLGAFEENFDKNAEFIDLSVVLKNTILKVTNYGRRLVHHPFDVHLAHFYEQCIEAHVGYFGSVVVSLVSQENYNFLDAQIEKKADLEYLIQLFEDYRTSNDKAEFCHKLNISFKGMENAHRVFKHLNHSKDGSIEVVLGIFSRCFEHNLCTRLPDGSYQHHRLKETVFIHPTSGFFKRKDKKIVVVDVFCTTKAYARIVGKYYDRQ